MRKCTEYKEMIYEYLDNDLDSNLLPEFEGHIQICPSCKVDLDELKQTLSLISSLEEEKLPQNFKESLHAKLIDEKANLDKKNNILFIRKKYFGIIGSIAAIFIFAIILRGFLGKQVTMSTADKNAAMSKVALSVSEEAAVAKESAQSNIANNVEAGATGGVMRKGIMKDEITDSTQSTNTENKEAADVTVVFDEPSNAAQSTNNKEKVAADVPVASVGATSQKAEKIIESTKIVLKVDKPENEIEKIKTNLKENGAKLIENRDLQTAAQFSSMSRVAPETGSLQVEFLIPNAELNKALDSLKAEWGEDAITSNANEIVLIKVTDKINELNAKLVELDNNIASFDKDNQNNTALKDLEAEKNDIQSEIEELKKDVEYSIITLSVEIKK